jgi:linoleoyl-CoA desaturase
MGPEIRFKRDEKGGFYHTLNSRVDDYFNGKNISRKANSYAKIKAFVFLLVFSGIATLIYTANGNLTQLLLSFVALGFFQICIALILGHEGVHGSFGKSPRLNKIMSFAFDLIGTSGYLWGVRHVNSHHPYPMVPEMDVDIQQSPLLTFVPMEKPKKAFRYQFIYAPFLYLMYTLQVVFKRDFSDFLSKKIGNKEVHHNNQAWLELIIAKIIYFTYTLVLPLMLSGAYWGWVVLGFVLMHFSASITAAVALFPAHIQEDSEFPRPDENGVMAHTWAEHQIFVTMDFGTRWKMVGFFFGGINYHAVHHLFPSVCHVHFHPIHKILVKTCKEFNVRHNEQPYLYKALISHVKLLKKNGVSLKEMHHLSEVM